MSSGIRAAQPVDDVIVLDRDVEQNANEIVPVVVELRLVDLQALAEMQDIYEGKKGSRVTRSEIVRGAIQFYLERHPEVII